MSAQSQPEQSPWPEARVHQGRQVCTGLLRRALLGLAPGAADGPADRVADRADQGPLPLAGVRVLWLADTDFADWPLDEPAVLAALSAWLRQGGRLLRLASDDFEATARRHPRLARWRRDWTHVTETWTPSEGRLPPALQGLLAAPVWLQRQDAPDWRIRCFTDPVHSRAIHAQIADYLQRCALAWPVTSLGL